MTRRNGHRAVGVVLVGLFAGACDGIWDLDHLGAPAAPDGPRLDGPAELGLKNRKRIEELANVADDGEPSVTADATELYFKSTRTGGQGNHDIWRSTRATKDAPWSTPTPVTELSTSNDETSPKVAPDGLTIYIQRTVTGSPGMPYVSTRASRDATWSPPVLLSEFDGAVVDNQFSSTTPDQLVGYLTSEHGTTTRPHLFRTTRATNKEQWGAPVEIAELMSTIGRNMSAWPAPDDLSIMWMSDRGGTLGGFDLWLATRATPADPFGPAINLGELNNEFFQADPWPTPDLSYIVFASNEMGDLEIYEASR